MSIYLAPLFYFRKTCDDTKTVVLSFLTGLGPQVRQYYQNTFPVGPWGCIRSYSTTQERVDRNTTFTLHFCVSWTSFVTQLWEDIEI